MSWAYWYALFEVAFAVGLIAYLSFNRPGGPT